MILEFSSIIINVSIDCLKIFLIEIFPGWQSNHPEQACDEVSLRHWRQQLTQDTQGSLEGVFDRETKSGAVSPPGDVERLQHQRQNQSDGDTSPPPHASLLEGESWELSKEWRNFISAHFTLLKRIWHANIFQHWTSHSQLLRRGFSNDGFMRRIYTKNICSI